MQKAPTKKCGLTRGDRCSNAAQDETRSVEALRHSASAAMPPFGNERSIAATRRSHHCGTGSGERTRLAGSGRRLRPGSGEEPRAASPRGNRSMIPPNARVCLGSGPRRRTQGHHVARQEVPRGEACGWARKRRFARARISFM